MIKIIQLTYKQDREKQTKRNLTAKEIYNRCNNAIFYIKTYDINKICFSSGSGFFIEKMEKQLQIFICVGRCVFGSGYSARWNRV